MECSVLYIRISTILSSVDVISNGLKKKKKITRLLFEVSRRSIEYLQRVCSFLNTSSEFSIACSVRCLIGGTFSRCL